MQKDKIMKEILNSRKKERRAVIDLDYFMNGGIEKRDYSTLRRKSDKNRS